MHEEDKIKPLDVILFIVFGLGPIIIVFLGFMLSSFLGGSSSTKSGPYEEYGPSENIREESLDDRYERHLQDQSDEAEAERMAPDWY